MLLTNRHRRPRLRRIIAWLVAAALALLPLHVAGAGFGPTAASADVDHCGDGGKGGAADHCQACGNCHVVASIWHVPSLSPDVPPMPGSRSVPVLAGITLLPALHPPLA